ncbi:lysostaphin resistance A-like protein [Paenibacillus chitinolyticus]|uniref:CPBP family intramembrane glutamic endopeptidase n=1 Tax=Paenibacillus chitinolyticus TaxID=79263 RepID=UPI0035566A75
MIKPSLETQGGRASTGLTRDTGGRIHLVWRILLGWLSFVVALGVAVAVTLAAQNYGFPVLAQQIILAVVTTGIAVPLIYLLRRYADNRPWSGLGLSPLPSGFRYLLLGAGFLIAMMGIALLAGTLAGWVRVVDVHLPVETLLVILINIPIAFFYEAFPEEVTFRGYLYGNLSERFNRWLALLSQLILFVLAPVALTAALVAAGVGTWDLITIDYVVNLLAFGIALQLCRIFTGNLWMCIGFHLAWLEMVRFVIVPSDSALIEVEYLSPYGSYLVSLGSVMIGILVLLYWTYRNRNRQK